MRIINDYECHDCMKVTEEYEESDTLTLICKCGGVKHKLIGKGAYFRIDGSRMDLMSEQWAKSRETRARKIRDNNG